MAAWLRSGRRGRGFLAALLSTGMIGAGAGTPALAQDASALPSVVGRVALVDGPASFREAAADPWAAAVANTPAIAGTSLWTQPSSRAEIELGNARFWLDGATEADINQLDDRQVVVTLPQGRVDIRLGGLRPGDSYVVTTPSGSVALEAAGAYRITAGDPQTPAGVAVFTGRADFSSAGGTQTVEGGQQALAADSAAANPFGAAEPDAFDQWVDGQEGQQSGTVSQQFVPPGIPGTADLDAYGQWRQVPDYGTVWVPTQVPADWQPYRDGHWQWIDPWGWTWVDNAPWGFAPFHYGRWVNINGWWSWVPGGRAIEPAYAPALVSFVGDPGALVDGGGPCVGWFPLGPGEVYQPDWVGIGGGIGLGVSFDYFRRLNPGIGADRLARFDDHGRYHDRDSGGGNTYINQHFTTIVTRNSFVGAQPVRDGFRPLHAGAIIHAAARPSDAALPMAPSRASQGDYAVQAPPRPHPFTTSGGQAAGVGRVGISPAAIGRPASPVTVFRAGVGSVNPVGAPPAPLRPSVTFSSGIQPVRPIAPMAPLHPVAPTMVYHPPLDQQPVPVRQPQYQVPYQQLYRPQAQYRQPAAVPQFHQTQPAYRPPPQAVRVPDFHSSPPRPVTSSQGVPRKLP